jgi:ribosomal protein S18 acetylase RimI-like enzyme
MQTIQIREITHYCPEVVAAINRFVSQLTGAESRITKQQFEAIIADPNSHLFFAENEEGLSLGMISLAVYTTATGRKAWIEDVVVDALYRRQGVGKALTLFAIQYAKEQQADVLMLTSKPARISANKLYRKAGFEPRETNVYRMTLTQSKSS